jgi:hypothetical protein
LLAEACHFPLKAGDLLLLGHLRFEQVLDVGTQPVDALHQSSILRKDGGGQHHHENEIRWNPIHAANLEIQPAGRKGEVDLTRLKET